jgi:hypothetical protein
MSSVAFTACAWYTTTYLGVDRHTWDVPRTSFSPAAKVSPTTTSHPKPTNPLTPAQMAWILQLLMLLSSGATKASVLLFYRRLVTGTLARRWKLAIYFALAFHITYLIGITLGYILICRPLQAYWMSFDYTWHQPYMCVDAHGLNPVIGVLSVLSDIYAVALPFAILHNYKLDVPRVQRIGLNVVFALGLLIAGAGVGRTYYLTKLGKSYDTSWTGFDLLVWTIVELQLGIVCACAPALRAFFRSCLSQTLRRSLMSLKSRGGTHNGNSTGGQRSHREGISMDMQILTRRSSDLDDGMRSEVPFRLASPGRTYQS